MIVVRSSWFVTHGSWLVKALSTSHEQLATSHKKRAVYKDSSFFTHNMVGGNGFEPSTPSMSTRYSNQLS